MKTRTEQAGRLAPLAEIFPEGLRDSIGGLLREKGDRLEEIRLRAGCPVTWTAGDRELILTAPAEASEAGDLLGSRTVCCTAGDLEQILRRASDHAAYAVQDQLTAGFLSLPGGHRLGVCGQAVPGPDGIRSIRALQSVNLRIAREIPGCADAAVSFLWSNPASTLILGPPGSGKTTVLRDLIRQLSDRFRERVGLVDERGEIAACVEGTPQLRVGQRTDVLSLCPKETGILLLLRSMAPRWIAVDEISAKADAEALVRASYCGVRFAATAHAWDRSDLQRRPLYRSLLEAGVFENLVTVNPDRSLRCERIGEAL